jgi:hypothetical protein
MVEPPAAIGTRCILEPAVPDDEHFVIAPLLLDPLRSCPPVVGSVVFSPAGAADRLADRTPPMEVVE